ncbi:hypothetical protein Y032_0073g792 [Ancylostoma ceylanicum]|uniref:Uncharacterized protein n=1 Tax=Ancylostoma ceylanicum TaxID=53326 RepID=A0A016TX61_9BILA|nr:hypothetical protein Y032_0073g792 [Ancylostoma ceylanicum]
MVNRSTMEENGFLALHIRIYEEKEVRILNGKQKEGHSSKKKALARKKIKNMPHNSAYLSLILTNGVLEQLSEDVGPLLQAGRAAHAPQALCARKLSADCAYGLHQLFELR